MAEEKEETKFYVGVKDPIEIRRSILESSKEMLQYLQRAEKFKEVRKEKTEQIEKLKATMSDINNLARKLKNLLPKTGIRATAPKKEEKPKKAAKKIEKKKAAKKEAKKTPKKVVKEAPAEKPKEMTELEKLEAELGAIEGRLTKLT